MFTGIIQRFLSWVLILSNPVYLLQQMWACPNYEQMKATRGSLTEVVPFSLGLSPTQTRHKNTPDSSNNKSRVCYSVILLWILLWLTGNRCTRLALVCDYPLGWYLLIRDSHGWGKNYKRGGVLMLVISAPVRREQEDQVVHWVNLSYILSSILAWAIRPPYQ